jgi:short chain dehydrogenase
MARVFVTGSADGLGEMAAELLIEQGHKVVLHARSAARADETRKKIAGAEDIVVGDLASIAETKSVADQVNKLGRFDAVIHNAGIGYREPKLVKTADGLPQLFAVNTLGPYILTASSGCRSDWCTCPLVCITAPDRISTTCCGRSGDGTAPKPTPKPSFRMCCWHSRWRDCFPG